MGRVLQDDGTITSRPERSTDLTARVFVRPSALSAPVDERLLDLRRLEAAGELAAVLVRVWPGEVSLSSADPDTAAVDAYERFREWARRNELSIEPPFRRREVDSRVTGETRRVLSTPMVCLAIHAADALLAVYPHDDGDDHRTVGDGIDALARGRFRDRSGSTTVPETGRRSPARDCPDCGGRVVNVQGTTACRACEWTAPDSTGGQRLRVERQ